MSDWILAIITGASAVVSIAFAVDAWRMALGGVPLRPWWRRRPWGRR